MKKIWLITIMMVTLFNVARTQQADDIFVYKFGNCELILLSEGQNTGKNDILIGATPQMLEKYVPTGTFPNATNTFLLKTSEKNILFDSGYGKSLFNNLKIAGVYPDEINVIFLTHMHGDHIGGMLLDEKVAFTNAKVYLSQQEYDYWTSDEAMKAVPENRRGGFLSARKVVEKYGKQIKLFKPEEIGLNISEIEKEIYGISSFGHTPGHTSFLIESENEQILIWGDLTHAMAIQMPYPQVAVTYDVDPDLAVKSRLKILEYISKNNIPVAGMHVAFPAMGKVKNISKDSYSFDPLR